jgi:hypothetical protein
MVISGTMPRWQRIMHKFGFSVMCIAFTAIALLSVRFLIHSPGLPTAESRSLFVTSLLMIAFAVSAIGGQVWFLRRVVRKFSYDGNVLRFSTLGTAETQSRNVSEITEITEWQGRGGPQGYRLRFLDGQKIYLQYGVANCAAAVERMRQDSRRPTQ